MFAMAVTWDEFAFAMTKMSQLMSRVGPLHWMAVKHVMRYLKDTLDFKVCLTVKDIPLREFNDAGCVGDAKDRRSTTGHMFLGGIGVISWKCKKQPTIAFSTKEVEYMATNHCMKEIV